MLYQSNPFCLLSISSDGLHLAAVLSRAPAAVFEMRKVSVTHGVRVTAKETHVKLWGEWELMLKLIKYFLFKRLERLSQVPPDKNWPTPVLRRLISTGFDKFASSKAR
jgi:hypothetical protein